jgi:hypothetical protein
VVDDLIKLALILEGQAGRTAGEPFRIECRYDDETGRLTLGSRPAGADAALTPPDGRLVFAQVARALRDGFLREVVWNHAAVAEYVWIPLVAGRKYGVHVGYHGLNGVHSFRALVPLGERLPEAVLAALAPLLTESQARGVPSLEAPPRSALERLE